MSVVIILIAFLFLVFIEVIEINIFNISYNTKKNIDLRSKDEALIEFSSVTTIDVDFELERNIESKTTL